MLTNTRTARDGGVWPRDGIVLWPKRASEKVVSRGTLFSVSDFAERRENPRKRPTGMATVAFVYFMFLIFFNRLSALIDCYANDYFFMIK